MSITCTPRGLHRNADNRQVFTAGLAQLAFYPLDHMDVISPRPVLLIAGEKADTRFYSQIAYDKAKSPRELFIVPGATHMDMYDKAQFVSPAVHETKGVLRKELEIRRKYEEKNRKYLYESITSRTVFLNSECARVRRTTKTSKSSYYASHECGTRNN